MNGCRAVACATKGCQATIHLHHDTLSRLKQTHETFYCPAGHANYYPGKTDEEERIANLQRRVARWREKWEEVCDERDDWRVQARTCPFECGYRVLRKSKPENIAAAVAMHLVEAHGAVLPVLEEVEA